MNELPTQRKRLRVSSRVWFEDGRYFCIAIGQRVVFRWRLERAR